MQALNGSAATTGAWEAIHALSYHTYVTDLDTIINETTSLHQQFNKPVWITEIASGSDSTAAANLALMQGFVPWANSRPWIERYFWNQAVSCTADRFLCTSTSPSSPMTPCTCTRQPAQRSRMGLGCLLSKFMLLLSVQTAHQLLLSSTHMLLLPCNKCCISSSELRVVITACSMTVHARHVIWLH